MAVSMLYLMHPGSNLLLKRGTDHACFSVFRQLRSFCPIRKDPCTHLFQSLSMLQLHTSSRMLSTKQIQTLLPTLYLQGPLGTALRLSHRQLLEAQPKCLSNGESFEFKSRCFPSRNSIVTADSVKRCTRRVDSGYESDVWTCTQPISIPPVRPCVSNCCHLVSEQIGNGTSL